MLCHKLFFVLHILHINKLMLQQHTELLLRLTVYLLHFYYNYYVYIFTTHIAYIIHVLCALYSGLSVNTGISNKTKKDAVTLMRLLIEKVNTKMSTT